MKPPATRVINYDHPNSNPDRASPHSPWQILIESSRLKSEVTLRELSKATQPNSPSGPKGIYHSTLFLWINSTTPCPSATNYTPEINKAIANALRIDPDVLADAYNKSLPKIPLKKPRANHPRPAPHEQILDALEILARGGLTITLDAIATAKDTANTILSKGASLTAKKIADITRQIHE